MNRSCLEIIDSATPFRSFLAPFKELDFFSSRGQDSGISLYEDEDSFYLETPMYGVKPEDINVTFDRGGVLIQGKAREEKNGVKYLLKGSRNFSYSISLPMEKIDETSKIEAISQDGILKLVFPKAKASSPLKITVKSA